MADTSDPIAVAFVKERLRGYAQNRRAAKAFYRSTLAKWRNECDAIFKGLESEKVDDGRASEGVTQVTAEQVKRLIGLMEQERDVLEADGLDELFEVFAVSPIEAS